MKNLITIGNDGQAIVETNYFDHEQAQNGHMYLSWNAGAARLLVPDSQVDMISEMKTGEYAVLTRLKWMEQGGRDALEILFEDHSDTPFCLTLVIEQTDMPKLKPAEEFVLTVWTRNGEMLRLPAQYCLVSFTD